MKQKDKEVLLVDLCARLPYGVKILHKGWNYEWDDELSTVERVVGIDEDFIYTKVIDTHNGEEYRDDKWPIDTFDDKLLLRPMSSMTNEERFEIEQITGPDIEIRDDFINLLSPSVKRFSYLELLAIFEWLNVHHFDYNGLINKGLAIAVTEDNNPYK